MKRVLIIVSSIVLLAGLVIITSWKKPDKNYDALIAIDAATEGLEFSNDMYGIFLEDINHALDGGLYAEMIQNRDFEYNRTPEDMQWVNDFSVATKTGNWKERYTKPEPLFCWSLKKESSSAATISQSNASPLNQNNPMSLELNVQKLNGNISVINSGFWGISVKKGARYNLSFYSRKDGMYSGGINVSLESLSGKVYATKTITGVGENWKQFQTDFISSATDTNARFVIHPLSKGKLWFDIVSLFPYETFNQRSNGVRKDLAEMLKNLHPSFLRFPGGCVVEGATLENRVQWKKTIGDIANRPGTWNLWRYHTTDGIGFHDYLQLCEDLNTAPMYVVNVGMACQGRSAQCIPIGDIQDFINDTYDALEYAMGPVTSKYGSLRAKNGHPAPFKIKYVEIGNENYGDYYKKAYRQFYAAIKSKYPEIITILDEQTRFDNNNDFSYSGGIERIDEHFYKSPLFFYNNETLYDSYDRKKMPKIYIGEFAVTTPDGGMGNLKAALGEASFMVGMERNADMVTMASYAPTFLNIHDQRWLPDMIVYDNNKVYGTPSYYALQLFSNNRPDYVLPSKITQTENSKESNDVLKGGIAFNNRGGQIAYKGIKIIKDGKDILNDDLNHGTDKWTIKADNWEAKNGILMNKFDEIKSNLWLVKNDLKDYSLQLKVKMIQGTGGIHIIFLNGGGSPCSLNMTENNFNLSQNKADESKATVLKKTSDKLVEGKWYDVKIDINGNIVKCYIDSELMADVALSSSLENEQVYSTAGIDKKNNEIIIKVVNPSSTYKICKINIDGKSFLSQGKALVLTSKSQDDENSLQHPKNIKPKTVLLNNVSSSFNYKSPAGSISVLRLKISD